MEDLLVLSENGIYCPKGDFYIDPWRPVDKAVISHAHSDHARFGHGSYLCHLHTKPLLELRLGSGLNIQSVDFGTDVNINGVKVSLHPAGHIIGSAQVRVEHMGRVEVFSGDYKTQSDGLSASFEPVKCHHFISESTFGMPVFKFRTQDVLSHAFASWLGENARKGLNSVVFAYSLGKAQRVLNLTPNTNPVFVHDSVFDTNQALQTMGFRLNPHQKSSDYHKKSHLGALIIAPPATMDSKWLKKFEPYASAYASGWMQIRGNKKRLAVDKGWVISDHADFEGLCQAVGETGCEKVSFTHGYTDFMARFFLEKGLGSQVLKTQFTGEETKTREETLAE